MREMKDSGIEWLGEIPSSWKVRRGKNVYWPIQRKIREDDEVITCFRDGQVTLRKNRREDGYTTALKEIGYQGIEPNDLVVHGMDGFAGSIGISDSRGKASPVLNVLDTDDDKKYLMYYLRAMAYKEVFSSLATGIRVRSCNLNWPKLAEIKILLPSKSEQCAIACYLDKHCGEIDLAIEAAKRSIEEYRAYKQSVIFEVATKGLNLNAAMKDSHLDWVGMIPEHWQVMPWKHLLNERNEKNDPPICTDILSLSANYGIHPYSERKGGGNKAKNNLADYKIARKNDIVLNSMNVVSGSVAISQYVGCISPVYYAYYPRLKEHDARFFNYLFQTIQFQRSLFGLGNGILYKESNSGKLNTVRMRISSATLNSLLLPVAPQEEQKQIANYLDTKCEKIEAAIKTKQSIIEELKAYKKSLIYEVVTGKREINGC